MKEPQAQSIICLKLCISSSLWSTAPLARCATGWCVAGDGQGEKVIRILRASGFGQMNSQSTPSLTPFTAGKIAALCSQIRCTSGGKERKLKRFDRKYIEYMKPDSTTVVSFYPPIYWQRHNCGIFLRIFLRQPIRWFYRHKTKVLFFEQNIPCSYDS